MTTTARATLRNTHIRTWTVRYTLAVENHSIPRLVTFTAPDNGTQHLRTVKYGQTVRLSDGYDTPTDTVGGLLQTAVTINPGDVVQNNDAGNTLYRYIGSAPKVFDLSGNAASTVPNAPQPPDFTDTTTWARASRERFTIGRQQKFISTAVRKAGAKP